MFNYWLELDVVGFILDFFNEIVENLFGFLEFFNVGVICCMGVEFKIVLMFLFGLCLVGIFFYIEMEIINNLEDNLEGKGLIGVF